jgi:hypothetical protein
MNERAVPRIHVFNHDLCYFFLQLRAVLKLVLDQSMVCTDRIIKYPKSTVLVESHPVDALPLKVHHLNDLAIFFLVKVLKGSKVFYIRTNSKVQDALFWTNPRVRANEGVVDSRADLTLDINPLEYIGVLSVECLFLFFQPLSDAIDVQKAH